MKLTTENSNTTTKWRAPYIVHYIRDRERFRTKLMSPGWRNVPVPRDQSLLQGKKVRLTHWLIGTDWGIRTIQGLEPDYASMTRVARCPAWVSPQSEGELVELLGKVLFSSVWRESNGHYVSSATRVIGTVFRWLKWEVEGYSVPPVWLLQRQTQ